MEGHELEVLRAWPFGQRWCVSVFTIENNHHCNRTQGILHQLHQLMPEYAHVRAVGHDEVFVRRTPCQNTAVPLAPGTQPVMMQSSATLTRPLLAATHGPGIARPSHGPSADSRFARPTSAAHHVGSVPHPAAYRPRMVSSSVPHGVGSTPRLSTRPSGPFADARFSTPSAREGVGHPVG